MKHIAIAGLGVVGGGARRWLSLGFTTWSAAAWQRFC